VRKQLGPYLEQKILSASPLELVTISYQCAAQAVRDARACLAEGNKRERAGCISLAHNIIAELYTSLDRKADGGKISGELGRLYDYMMRKLLEANTDQADAPLAEVLDLVTSLSEAWVKIANDPPAAQSAPRAETKAFAAPVQSWEIPAEPEPEPTRFSFSF
jgi:flagellar protein FliS